MKRILLLLLCLSFIPAAQTVFAQSMPTDMDPQTTQAIQEAVQRGDTEGAKKLYDDYKNSKKTDSSQSNLRTKPTETQGPSVFERTLSGKLPMDIFDADLQQFGYEAFLKTMSSFAPSGALPVGPDYIIGPGDQFTITLWGTTEGIYALKVTKEGNITLPKVGVVPVAGVRFGDLETTVRKHLSRYYSNFNLSIAMGSLKTITVYVVGEVENPGSYSLSSLSTVYTALFAAGGPTKKGTLRTIQVLRSGKVIKTVDLYDFLLKGDRSQDIKLRHDDTIFVPLIGPMAGVSGTVYRPAIYELKGGETIRDVLQMAGGIMPISVGSRLQVTRFSENQKKVILDVQVNPPDHAASKAIMGKVMNMDVLHVLPIYDKIWEMVSLQGDVRNPGNFQWKQDLKLKEILQEGQLLPTADLTKVEVVRLTDDFMDRKIITVNLAALMNGDESQDISLKPKDQVRVFTLYRAAEKVSVTGEVLFASNNDMEDVMNAGGTKPVMNAGTGTTGEYVIYRGERLSELLRRVGGFTREAYPYGAVFKRRDVKNTQDKNFQIFMTKMQSQILQTAAGSSTVSAEDTTAAKAEFTLNQSLLENMKAIQAQNEGRVSINITEDIDQWAGSKDDLLLKDGDSIYIPKKPQEVMVMGEVHSPGAQVYLPGNKVIDYINLTGGYTDAAELDQVYVLQANGFAFAGNSPSVGNIEKVPLRPGDTVFVPQKTERHVALTFFKDMIDLLYKTAIVVIAIHAL